MLKSLNKKAGRCVISCGIKVRPPQILIKYTEGEKMKLHKINMGNSSDIRHTISCIDDLYNSQNHCAFLDPIPKAQIIRLIYILRDLQNGVPLDESLKYNNEVEKISPTEDLNKETDEVVERQTVMNEQYEINLIGPNDPNFRYDLSVDFPEQRETSEWDSDMSDF
eukprot:TsM_000315400 transcript=TsM_000315400 gene=TsM_000315400